jgi:hypothetical protein
MKEFTKAEATALAQYDRAYSVYHLHGDVYGVWDAKGESLVEFDDRAISNLLAYGAR